MKSVDNWFKFPVLIFLEEIDKMFYTYNKQGILGALNFYSHNLVSKMLNQEKFNLVRVYIKIECRIHSLILLVSVHVPLGKTKPQTLLQACSCLSIYFYKNLDLLKTFKIFPSSKRGPHIIYTCIYLKHFIISDIYSLPFVK